MKIKVILNGGLKTCCRTLPIDIVRAVMAKWFDIDNNIEIDVIDQSESGVKLDKTAAQAVDYMGENAYPMIFIDDDLMSVGKIPEYKPLHHMVAQSHRTGLSEQDILDEAQNRGLFHPKT